jgi:predicted nucleic acid-binding protein
VSESGAVVIDASAVVEVLLRSPLGFAASDRMRGRRLHAPAHLDAEVLSALGRLHRAKQIDEPVVTTAFDRLIVAPIERHPLAPLLHGAWARRDSQRLVDALYVELAAILGSLPLLTTDARLARSQQGVELVTATPPPEAR